MVDDYRSLLIKINGNNMTKVVFTLYKLCDNPVVFICSFGSVNKVRIRSSSFNCFVATQLSLFDVVLC